MLIEKYSNLKNKARSFVSESIKQMYLTGNGRKPTATLPNIGLIAALMGDSAIVLKNSFDGDKIEIHE